MSRGRARLPEQVDLPGLFCIAGTPMNQALRRSLSVCSGFDDDVLPQKSSAHENKLFLARRQFHCHHLTAGLERITLHPRCQLVKIIELQPESHQKHLGSNRKYPREAKMCGVVLPTAHYWRILLASTSAESAMNCLGAKHRRRIGLHKLHVLKNGGFTADAYEDNEDESESASHR